MSAACGRHAVAAIVACVAAGAVHAQTFPVKPVRMVVPFAEGEAPASSEQGSRLRDAIVRESAVGTVQFRAGVASVFGVASPEGAPAPPYDGVPGHVSRRPARGNDARPPGFIRVAAQELAPYPSKPVRVVVPFAEGEASGHVSRRPARGNDARPPGFIRVAAQELAPYPSKPVRVVVPFAPGGGTDVIARHLAAGMSESLKRQVVVDNRAGANGIIGSEFVARAPADGYTLLFVSSPHSVNPSLYAKLPYDTLRDFAPVAMVASSPYVLVIHPSLPVRNVKEFIALAKSRPDQINYGSGGSGSSAHLAAELFNQMAGVKLREIPFKGAGPALIAVLSGEVAVDFGNALTVKPHIQSARLRALGIASVKRSESFPDLPTIAEAGVPRYRADAVLGFLAPANTPRAIIDFLNAEAHKAMRRPDMVEAMRGMAVDIALSTPEEFGRLIESEMQRWGKLVRALNLKAE